jgi:hypothetical protein
MPCDRAHVNQGVAVTTPPTPFFLPYPVLLHLNSTQQWEPDPAPARRRRRPQAETGHGRPERAPGQHGRDATPPPQRDCVEAVC